jgi:hypothetical protein
VYDLVWSRFSAFYTKTLRQEYVSTPYPSAASAILTLPSIKNCPTPLHVQRFISILPSQLKAKNQTGLLSLSTLESQFTILSTCLHFHYANWLFTEHDEKRMNSTLLSVIKRGSRLRGRGCLRLYCWWAKIPISNSIPLRIWKYNTKTPLLQDDQNLFELIKDFRILSRLVCSLTQSDLMKSPQLEHFVGLGIQLKRNSSNLNKVCVKKIYAYRLGRNSPQYLTLD